jgi:hypothetical protein
MFKIGNQWFGAGFWVLSALAWHDEGQEHQQQTA